MQTGLINPDNLSAALRAISQKRRHGVFTTQFNGKSMQVFFVQGKVVDVREPEVNSAHDLEAWLRRAGAIAATAVPINANSYDGLFHVLEATGSASLEQFKSAVRHRILDKLYELGEVEGGFFSFEAKMVEYEDQYCPSISVGQVLLDLVALKSDTARFLEGYPDDLKLIQTELGGVSLTFEEHRLYDLCPSPRSVAELRKVSLLSRYTFQDTLGALCERGFLISADLAPAENKLDEEADDVDEIEAANGLPTDFPHAVEVSADEQGRSPLSEPGAFATCEHSAIYQFMAEDPRVPATLAGLFLLCSLWGFIKLLSLTLAM